MSPGHGIPDPSWFGSTDVTPGMKNSRIVQPATVVQILQPSLPPHLKTVMRSAKTWIPDLTAMKKKRVLPKL